YWVALLLQAYGDRAVSAIDVALAASTLLPSQGNPKDWLPPGATSREGDGYDRIPTVSDLAVCGTSISGLIQATEQLSQGRFCLLPLQTSDWAAGVAALVNLCQRYPEWQAVPLLNLYTSYCWGSQLTLQQLLAYLQGRPISPPPADWSVGHFALLIGQLQGDRHSLYAVLDTYPHFGWQGLHLQPIEALAPSLQRPDFPTAGGIALFIRAEERSQITALVEKAGFCLQPWNNGTPTLHSK
ncbi:MAG: hypothetical protein AAGF66_18370, partial [Cyanobacteria bacterium P01_H01_bin.119]